MMEQDLLKEFPGWILERRRVDSGGSRDTIINKSIMDSVKGLETGGEAKDAKTWMQGRGTGPSSSIVYDDGGKGNQVDDAKDETADLLMKMGREEEDSSSVLLRDDDVEDGRAVQQGGNGLLERLIDVDFSGSAKDIAVPIMGAGFVVMAFSVAVSLLLGVLDGSKRDEVSESKDEVKKKQAGFNGPMGFVKSLTLFKKTNDNRDEIDAESSLAADSRQKEMLPRSDAYDTRYNDDDPDIARPTGGVLWRRKEDTDDQINTLYSDKEEADLWRMPLEELRSDAVQTVSGNHKAKDNSNNLEANGPTAESKGKNDNEIQPVQEELSPRRKSPVDILDNAEQTIVSPRRRG